MRPLWPGLAGWWVTFAALTALDVVLWYTAETDPAWRAAFAWAFLPLVVLAVYSAALALAGHLDRRALGRASARHPARRHPAARRLGWDEVRPLDPEVARQIGERYGPR